jgi:hypothetical protein
MTICSSVLNGLVILLYRSKGPKPSAYYIMHSNKLNFPIPIFDGEIRRHGHDITSSGLCRSSTVAWR